MGRKKPVCKNCGHRIWFDVLRSPALSSVWHHTHMLHNDNCPCRKPEPRKIYWEEIPEYGDAMTVEEFKDDVNTGCLIDYDGFGHPMKDGKMAGHLDIYPSRVDIIPEDATHIIWFNR